MKKILNKRTLRRLGLGLGTVGIIISGAVAFSAFESHLINVTARIENTLLVDTKSIEFGTVFPQEYLVSPLKVSMSNSFGSESGADDIDYVVKQKPKVKEPTCVEASPECDPNINPVPGDPSTIINPAGLFGSGVPAWKYCEENLPLNAPYSQNEPDLLNNIYWKYCYIPLADDLSKTKAVSESGETNDTSVPAFHQAYQWDGNNKSSLAAGAIAYGRLAKSENDREDNWIIDLKVPCFVNACAQEADDQSNLVDDGSPGFFVPLQFRLPSSTEHKLFGTDLWIEVTGISRVGGEPPPTSCFVILCENFNSYSIGAIVGQGGWIDRENGSTYIVQDALVKEGEKALYNNSNDSLESIITKTGGTALVNGKQAFYVRTENRSGWSDFRSGQNVQMGVYQGSWDGPSRAVLTFMRDGHVTYISNITDSYVNFDTYNDNAWNLAEIEWRTIDKSARFRINNGVWTNWIPFTGGSSFTGFDTVGLGSVLLGTGGVYFDDLR